MAFLAVLWQKLVAVVWTPPSPIDLGGEQAWYQICLYLSEKMVESTIQSHKRFMTEGAHRQFTHLSE